MYRTYKGKAVSHPIATELKPILPWFCFCLQKAPAHRLTKPTLLTFLLAAGFIAANILRLYRPVKRQIMKMPPAHL